MRHARIPTLQPSIAIADLRTAQPAAKSADPHYQSAAHVAWRDGVLRRAGFRCEWVEGGHRCERSAANGHRMFAHHVKERSDGGAALDPVNGMCLCGSHHTLVTNLNRMRRFGLARGAEGVGG